MTASLKTIFHWFYCLPISDAVLLVLLATGLYLWMRGKLWGTKVRKGAVPVLFSLWLAVILFGTLGQRTAGAESSEPILVPLYSYYVVLNGGERELLRVNFMNVVLFYPAGLLGWELLPGSWKKTKRLLLTAAGFALVSAGIEFIQYRFGLGLVEADDVLHNTLGAALGALVCMIPGKAGGTE